MVKNEKIDRDINRYDNAVSNRNDRYVHMSALKNYYHTNINGKAYLEKLLDNGCITMNDFDEIVNSNPES